MKKFCKVLREQVMKIINYEKKEMMSLIIEEDKSYHEQKICHICKKEFSIDDNDKVRDHCHFTGKYRKASKEIPVVFHNGSTYDYHFIIKELGKEFEGQFKCLGQNTEKYINLSVPIKNDRKLNTK